MLSMSSKIRKGIVCCTIIVVFLFLCSGATVRAQDPREADTYIWQDFEYWHAPVNYGWKSSCPPYPTFGWCPYTGFGRISTSLEPLLQSRVLFYECMMSVFNQFYPFYAWNQNVTYPDGSPINDKHIISFDIKLYFAVEYFDFWEVQLFVMSRNGKQVNLIYRPEGAMEEGPVFREGLNTGDIFVGQMDPPGFLFRIGREFQDGRWHHVLRDIDRDVDLTDDGIRNYSDGYGNAYGQPSGNSMILNIKFHGSTLMVDNIAFHTRAAIDAYENEPYLFKIGPRYAQIFEPYAYLFYVDYREYTYQTSVTDLLLMDANHRRPNSTQYGGALSPDNIFVTDTDEILAYWDNMGADPNYGYIADPNSPVARFRIDPNIPIAMGTYGRPDPGISSKMGHDLIVFPHLPIFRDPDFRWDVNATGNGIQNPAYTPSNISGYNKTFLWNATVGGFGANGVEFEGIMPLPINPADGMPTYIPVYGPEKTLDVVTNYGTPFFGPNVVPLLEAALYNAGFTHWPGIALLNYTPVVFEDIILTIEVTDGGGSDLETFPIEVTNYPVENYPPYIEDVDDRFFPVNGPADKTTYALSVVDPDCMIFSLASLQTTGTLPATSHTPWTPFFNISDTPRTDMSNITWHITLDGLPSYQYGPWMQSIINPINGVINFNPQFEGMYQAVVTAADALGAQGLASFTIFSTIPGTWLNHPPIVLSDWEHPQTVRAGERIVLTTPDIQIIDPDGDELYYSCNIGSCGRGLNGELMWTFLTYFPGNYTVEIVIYDIRGGYAIVRIDLVVTPWWSF